MPIGYEPISTTTLGSNASSVTFSSIPQTYTDLICVAWTKPYSGSEGALRLRYNSDTGTNYSYTYLSGDGSSATSGRGSNISVVAITTGNSLNNPRQPIYITHIMNYSNTTTYKTALTRTSDGTSQGYVDAWVDLWRSTSAITTLTYSTSYFDIGAGSTFTLYGIKAA
jgi:hypothetical protein